MAPKAKQQSQGAQPKAKAEVKAPAKAPAPAPKAEPKAEAKAKAKAEPKAETAAQRNKAEAKAQAKAKAQAEAAQAPAAAKSTPAAAEPKGKAKASPKAKVQAAAAPAPAAKAPVQEAAAPKSKSKKGKAAPPPPEPEPVVEEPEEVQGKKKKTNHRGGRNKNKEVDSFPEDEQEAAPKIVARPYGGKTVSEIAGAAAEKDPELKTLWQRYRDAPTGDTATLKQARRLEFEAIMQDIDKAMTAKKVPNRKVNVSSVQLLQSMDDLQQMAEEDRGDMMEAVKSELAEARASELWTALKGKFTDLKGQCENALKAASSTAPTAKTERSGPREKGAGKGEDTRKDPKEAEDRREAAILGRLCNLGKKEAKDVKGSMIETRNLELDLGITKYLFGQPYNFNSRFEQQFKVLVEPKRGEKGGKGGGKGAPPTKDVTITGLSADEVSACEKALKALDFSGQKTREISSTLVLPNREKSAVLEKEFNVIIFKNQDQLSVFGKSDAVTAALTKIEDEGTAKTLTVSADLVKMIYSTDLLAKWRAGGANISINQPPKSDVPKPAKITIHGKSKQETEDCYAKVEEFVNNTASEVVKADVAVVGKLFERSNGSFLAKRFREIQDGSKEVSMKKAADGLLLLGPKKGLAKAKAEVQELLKKASFEPEKVTMDGDQLRIFGKDHMEKIRESSGLIEMYKSKDKTENGFVDVIILLGDADAVTKAKAAIAEVIKNEGHSDSLEVTDQVCKGLLVEKGKKIQEFQEKEGTYIHVDRATLTIKILGSAKGVEASKKAIAAFAKKAGDMKSHTMALEEDQIGRVIGTKGATLQNISKKCSVQMSVDKTSGSPSVEIRGEQKGIDEAVKMLEEILEQAKAEATEGGKGEGKGRAEVADEPKKEKAKPKAKAKAFVADMTQDFPTLGGEPSAKAQPAAKAWGKKTTADGGEEKTPEEAKESEYPSLDAEQ